MQLPAVELESELVGLKLPPRILEPVNWQFGYYGALWVAANYCGFQKPPLRIPGEWQHGWAPPQHNIHPEVVVGGNGASEACRSTARFWVAREDQALYLKSHGYAHAEAIGLPIIYVPPPKVSRESGSMLVMPIHSLSYTTHSWNFDQYAEEIGSIANRFSRVVACIHPACFQKDYWVTEFKNRGVPAISGAETTDRNSLLRMALLFSRFEFVTSNGFGSQLAYAGHFGAKPSLFGTIVAYKPIDFANDTSFFRNHPDLLLPMLELLYEPYLRKTFPELFCVPWMAKTCVQWGSWNLGLQCMRSPRDLRTLFEWTFANRAISQARSLARKTPFWRAVKALRNRLRNGRFL
jgi:hypothetical protein